MGTLSKYKVDLRGMTEPSATYEMNVDNEFFAHIEGPEVQKGHADVTTTVTKKGDKYVLSFDIKGTVIVTCDRCLDEMPQDIETTGTIEVRLGKAFGEDGDVVVIPEYPGELNVAWYIYEFVALAIPMKHVHAPGKCNRDMSQRLSSMTVDELEEGEGAGDGNETDPRWDALKEILDN